METETCTGMSGGSERGRGGVWVGLVCGLVWGRWWSVVVGCVSVCVCVRALGRCARDSLRAKISSSSSCIIALGGAS